MQISILYGTETGNAEMLAEDLELSLQDDHDVECHNMITVDPGDLNPERLYLVICSTYGDGEMPFSAKPFVERMEAEKPGLDGLRFAMFGLGDMVYEETFNFAPIALAKLFTDLGATQLGERAAHDASGPDLAEDMIVPWAEGILTSAAKSSKAA
ncbi:MAG: flavodoxin family protein [Pseudomonadota bacterium]